MVKLVQISKFQGSASFNYYNPVSKTVENQTKPTEERVTVFHPAELTSLRIGAGRGS